jgi:hypothetical protein
MNSVVVVVVVGVVCRCVWMYDVVGLSWAEISVRENYARLLNGSQTSGEWGAAIDSLPRSNLTTKIESISLHIQKTQA